MSSKPSSRSPSAELDPSVQLSGTKRKLTPHSDRNVRLGSADSESESANSELELPATKRLKVSTSIDECEQRSEILDSEDDDECEEKGSDDDDDGSVDATTDEVYSDAFEAEKEMVTATGMDYSEDNENENVTRAELVNTALSSDVEGQGDDENGNFGGNENISTVEPLTGPVNRIIFISFRRCSFILFPRAKSAFQMTRMSIAMTLK